MRLKVFFLVTLTFILFFYGCSPDDDNNNSYDELAAKLEEKNAEINQVKYEKEQKEREIATLESLITGLEGEIASLEGPNPDSSHLITALEVVELLQIQDMEALSKYAHPKQGVRFSPYAYVQPDKDLVFSSEELKNLMHDDEVYTWGAFDGKGNPIALTFKDYYERFIYDKDFANPHKIGNNRAIGSGNTINNINEIYPAGKFVEFYFPGLNPDYGGMDWRSLRLVLEEFENTFYLVGIVHDEWTI